MADGDSGKGFAPQVARENADAEARGRKALEKLRAEAAAANAPPPAEVPPEEVEVPEEFKSDLTLGLAGFLILVGVVSLVVGGPLWESKQFDQDSAPAEAGPAFGFVPTPLEKQQANEAIAQ